MGRPDWRTMCRDDIHRMCRLAPFLPHALFSGYPAGYAFFRADVRWHSSLFFCDPDMHPSDFSLLVPRHEEEQVERPDEDKMLMQKAAGLRRRPGSVGTEGAIFYRLRMWRMSWWMMPH
ncbi:phage tail assembly protein T [Escherichia coli]|uniref:phage tail assembly protein T n=1 Tax=Escherichia coli TaxID=562 RepID=UPI00388E6439